MACLEERFLRTKSGAFCDMDLTHTMIINDTPYLKNCTQILIECRMEGEKIPFAKFSYKAKDGYLPFEYRSVTDEDNGIFLIKLTQDLTAKAKVGVVVFDYTITIPDNLRPATGFNDLYSMQIFKFRDYVN